MLEITNLSKTFKIKSREIKAVKPYDLTINKGEVVAFIGPNGAGKTTSIKMLCGLVTPTTGLISLNNTFISKRTKYLSQLGAVLEGARNIYWRLNPFENMEVFCRMRGLSPKTYLDRIDHYIKLLDLEKYKTTECRYLSRGNQQKVAIACILALNAEVLLLDEPTLGLDIEMSHRMMEIIAGEKSKDRIIIVTTHDMEFIEQTVDRVVAFKDGNVFFKSTPTEIISKFGNGDNRLSTAYLKAIKEETL